MVFEFDDKMNLLNNYALMDLDAHGLKKKDPTLSYNNILMNKYKKDDDGLDPIRDIVKYSH